MRYEVAMSDGIVYTLTQNGVSEYLNQLVDEEGSIDKVCLQLHMSHRSFNRLIESEIIGDDVLDRILCVFEGNKTIHSFEWYTTDELKEMGVKIH